MIFFKIGVVSIWTSLATVIPSAFIWQISGCNSTSPYCNPYYNRHDAPMVSDLCLLASGETCTIHYTTYLNFDSQEICAREYDLWINIGLMRQWQFASRPIVRLSGAGSDLPACQNYTATSIPTDATSIIWCAVLDAHPELVFNRIVFSDTYQARLPNQVIVGESNYLILRSPVPNKQCWLSRTQQVSFALAASYHASNIGAVPVPHIKSDQIEHALVFCIVALTFLAILSLVSIHKFRQASFIIRQEAAARVLESMGEVVKPKLY